MRLTMLVAILLCASVSANADVMYSLTGAGLYAGTSFTVTAPNYLSYSGSYVTSSAAAGITVAGVYSQFSTSYGAIVGVRFTDPTNIAVLLQSASNGISNGIGYSALTSSVQNYNVAANGTYTDFFGSKLVVSGTPRSVAVTPEPSSIALLGIGLVGVGAAVRRPHQTEEKTFR